MKSNLAYKYQNFKYSLDTQKFKIVFLLSLISAIYGVCTFAFKMDYVNGFLNILNAFFYILMLVLIILINTLNTFDIYTSNKFYIMRFNNRKQFLVDLIKGIVFNNFMIIIMNIFLVIIGLNIFNENTDLFTVNSDGIHIWIYLIYKILKFIILLEIISVANTLILFVFNKKIVLLVNFCLCMLLVAVPYTQTGSIDSIVKIPLFIWQYFFTYKYSNFIFEIVSFLLYIMIAIGILKLSTNLIIKYVKKLGV